MKRLLLTLASLALLGATPSPVPTDQKLSVVCARAHLYVFQNGSNQPTRAHTADVTLGQRFGLVSGPRTTLSSDQYYETDIPVVEPGYARNAHYWISRDCAMPS